MSDWKSRAKPSGSWKERAKPVNQDERMRRAQADEGEPAEPSLEEQKAEFLPFMQPGAEVAGLPVGDFAKGISSGFTADLDDEALGVLAATDPAEYQTPEAPLADPLDAEPRHENSPLMAGFISRSDSKKPGLVDRYRKERDSFRADKEASRAASPKAYFAGQLLGAMGNPVGRAVKGGSLLATAVKTALSAGGYGALAGLGASKADLTKGEVGQALKDVGLTAGLSAATAGGSTLLAQPVSKGFSKLADFAKSKAMERAKANALSAIREASGALGGETQKGSRALENTGRSLLTEELSPAARQAVEAARATPEARALAEQVALKSADTLKSQAAKIAAAEAALAPALEKGSPAALKAAQGEILSRPEMRSGLATVAKRLALPAGGYIADRVLGGDGGMGGMIGGIAALSTGKPALILRNRFATPAFQNALGEVGSRAAMAVPGGVSAIAAAPQTNDALTEYLQMLADEDATK